MRDTSHKMDRQTTLVFSHPGKERDAFSQIRGMVDSKLKVSVTATSVGDQ